MSPRPHPAAAAVRARAPASAAARRAYRILYKNSLSLEEAKVQLSELAQAGGDGDAAVKSLVDFVESSQRGIIR